jgi:multicomponent Na+:H+ antiporter subunit A
MLSSLIFLCLLAAPLSLIIRRNIRQGSEWVLALVPLSCAGFLFTQIGTVVAGRPVVENYFWARNIGAGLDFDISFTLDSLSLLFALLITLVGTFSMLHAGHILTRRRQSDLFFFYTFAFLGSMLGLVLAGNVLTLMIFWLLVPVCSYLLIGYRHEMLAVRYVARQAWFVSLGGSLVLLIGLFILGESLRSLGMPMIDAYDLAVIRSTGGTLSTTATYVPAMLCIMIGCFTSSAQMPFHFWHTSAMQAPAPISIYLHTITMVTTGIYLLARLAPALSTTILWSDILIIAGGSSFVLGAAFALRQSDARPLLAYATTSQMGLMLLLLGTNSPSTQAALIAALLTYICSVGALFFLVGITANSKGSYNLEPTQPTRSRMPLAPWLVLLAALSLAGMPLLFGFVARELAFEAAFTNSLPVLEYSFVFLVLALGVALTIIYLWRLIRYVFVAPALHSATHSATHSAQRSIKAAPPGMLLGPALLGACSLAFGIPGAGQVFAADALINPAASLVAGRPINVEIGLWQSPGSLVLSLLVLALGVALVRYEHLLISLFRSLPAQLSAQRACDQMLRLFYMLATILMRPIQGDKLRIAVAAMLMVWLGLIGPLLLTFGFRYLDLPLAEPLSRELFSYEILIVLPIPIGIMLMIRTRSRLEALAGLGIVGSTLALFFTIFSAPDLALMQALEAALLTAFFIFSFPLIPIRATTKAPNLMRLRDIIIASGAGLLVALLTFATAVSSIPIRSIPVTAEDIPASSQLFNRVSSYYVDTVGAQEGPVNVVQMILLDFRSFDTFGILVVWFTALLGIVGLLRSSPRRHQPGQQQAARKSALAVPAEPSEPAEIEVR